MNIAFMGAQGTGKSTTLQAIINKLPHPSYIIGDQYRLIAKALNYNNPRQIILEGGSYQYTQSMSAFVSTALGSFTQLDISQAHYNFADLDPITYYAFYLYWINKDAKKRAIQPYALPFIEKLVDYYSQKFNLHFYFPIDIIPLKSDDMRAFDPEFQQEIESLLRQSLDKFNIKILNLLQKKPIESRCDEIIYWINKYNN
ncbi:ATP-binding protein [Piscirickettsia litoralis]|uniref:NadR/Ttd14 AAA domain-containing protein n=1 Tax=Piscirickettsia litoralis TaxID=1891921 RepID=A0ABX3A2B8_9GAMM|nr:ATP-binding protein [Piscirickettsia litoralis]ODN43016.1 hypothetical protein BGC07_08935 [Piscirickettsia litoralis]